MKPSNQSIQPNSLNLPELATTVNHAYLNYCQRMSCPNCIFGSWNISCSAALLELAMWIGVCSLVMPNNKLVASVSLLYEDFVTGYNKLNDYYKHYSQLQPLLNQYFSHRDNFKSEEDIKELDEASVLESIIRQMCGL